MRCIAIKERSLGGTHPQVQPPRDFPHSRILTAAVRQPSPCSSLRSVS